MNTLQKKHSLDLRLSAVLAFGLAAGASFGYDPSDYSTWYQFSGNKNTKCFVDSCWYDPAVGTDTMTAAQAGFNYFVPSGSEAGAATATATFKGESLAVAGTLIYGTANATYTVKNLILRPGGMLKANTSHYVAGKLTVEGTADSPSIWQTFVQSGRTWKYQPALVGDSTAFLYVGSAGSPERSTLFIDTHDVTMDMSAYEGEIVFRGVRFVFNPSKTSIPGKITVCTSAILEMKSTTASYTVGSLSFEDDAELRLNTTYNNCAYFNVTNAIAFGSSFSVSMTTLSTNGYRIATLSGAAADTAPDVSNVQVTVLDKMGELPRNPRLEIVDNGDGTKDVRLAYDPIKVMISNNSSSKSCWTATSTDCWADGEVPGKDYSGDVYTKTTMYFSEYSNMIYNDLTLTVHGAALHADSYGLTLKQINFVGTCDLDACHNGGAQTHVVYAPICLYDANLTLKGNSSIERWGQVSGPIDGSGSITIYSEGSGTWKVNSDMTGFTGDVKYTGNNGDVEDRPGRYVELMGKSPFGGDYEGNDPWKAVQFTGNPWVYVSGTVGMTNVQRGTIVSGHVNFEVATGKSLTLGGLSTTYDGTLTKRGAGALVLASEAKFAAAGVQQDTPIVDANNLVVTAGTLEVAAVDAVNGLAVSFGPEASLVVNVGATGDLKTYGARNVKWETPFAADAAIPVVFTGEMAEDSDTFAICTISETAVTPTFTVPAKYAHRKVSAAGWRTNDDGSKTFEVALEKQGLILLFR